MTVRLLVMMVCLAAASPAVAQRLSCAPEGALEEFLTLKAPVVVNVLSCEEDPSDLKRRMERRLLAMCLKARLKAGEECRVGSCDEGTSCFERVGVDQRAIKKFAADNIIRLRDCPGEVGYLITWHYLETVTCACECLDVE